MSRDQSHLDNPERCAPPGEAPSDYRAPERDEDADYEEHRDRLLLDGKFGEVQHGNQFQEQGCFHTPNYFSIVKQAALQAHSDFCVTHSIPQPFKPKD